MRNTEGRHQTTEECIKDLKRRVEILEDKVGLNKSSDGKTRFADCLALRDEVFIFELE